MADVFDAAKRSWLMSRIRGTNTKPERIVRSLLHRMGFRFTLRGPHNRRLPGRPEIVLPRHRTVVFVHGCFWHGHPGCKTFRLPKSRRAWWRKKIDGNRSRDARHEEALRALGWRVIVVWECSLRRKAGLDELALLLERGWRSTARCVRIRYDESAGDGDPLLLVAEQGEDEPAGRRPRGPRPG